MTKTCRVCENKLNEEDTFYKLEAIKYQYFATHTGTADGGFKTNTPKSHPTLSTGIHTICEKCFKIHYDSVHIRMVGLQGVIWRE